MEGLERLAKIILFIGAFIITPIIILFIWKQNLFDTAKQIDSSRFGDLGSFLSGSIGVIVSLASVIYFVLALKEQRKDINDNQRVQNLLRFETTFFNLLQLHANTVHELTYSTDRYELDGKKIFDLWKIRLDELSKGEINEAVSDGAGGFYSELISKAETVFEYRSYLNEVYYDYYQSFENTFNHYFRQLYHIFKYIHLSELIEDNKRKFYVGLLRSQLSQNELYAIAFNAVYKDYGYPKFAYLIKKYKILKNFNYKAIPNELAWNCVKKEIEDVSNPFTR